MVLANGNMVTANACQHPDLFFALRGGGGGTYGVVTSMTIKAHPSKSVAAQSLTITPMHDDIEALLDAITDVYEAYPSLDDAGYSGYGSWSIATPVPTFGNATAGFTHVIAMMGKTMQEAQVAAAPLLSTLRQYNGTSLFVSVDWFEFPTYGAYYEALSGVQQPAGDANSILTSRMFDGPSLTQRKAALRAMIGEIAGTKDQFTSNNVEIVGGGAVFNNDPSSGVDPAWRSTYLVNIAARGWAPGTDAKTIKSIENDITYVKGGAMRLQTPGMGSYMNEVRILPQSINSLANRLDRLTGMIPFGLGISTALIMPAFSRSRSSMIPKIPFTALRVSGASSGSSTIYLARIMVLCAGHIWRGYAHPTRPHRYPRFIIIDGVTGSDLPKFGIVR